MLPIFESEFSNFNQPVAVKDIILEQNFFFSLIANFSALPHSQNQKKCKNAPS